MAVRKRSAWDAFELPRGHLGNKLKCCPCTFFLNLPGNPCWEPVERKHSPGIRASTDKLTISPGYIWENPVKTTRLSFGYSSLFELLVRNAKIRGNHDLNPYSYDIANYIRTSSINCSGVCALLSHRKVKMTYIHSAADRGQFLPLEF